jgi:hypothetical protein
MAKCKVLYVDDHIPDTSIPDEKDLIKSTLKERHPNKKDEALDEWVRVYYYARRVIRALQDATYEVVSANNYQDAIQLVENSQFDVAIIDLGWYNDNNLPIEVQKNRGNAGWYICDKIDEIDKKEQRHPTLKIAFSNRFTSQPDLSIIAAQKGALPFFKTYHETNAMALRAVVEFLHTQLGARGEAGSR